MYQRFRVVILVREQAASGSQQGLHSDSLLQKDNNVKNLNIHFSTDGHLLMALTEEELNVILQHVSQFAQKSLSEIAIFTQRTWYQTAN